MNLSRSLSVILWLALFGAGHSTAVGQSHSSKIDWLTFDQLDDSLQHANTQAKKVFIAFYADWCSSCKRMDKTTFQDEKIQKLLNEGYYAVKMDVESTDTVRFGNQVFINENRNKPMPVHQVPLLMGSRRGKPFSLPIMIILDEDFQAQARYFQYLGSKELGKILLHGK